MKLYLIKYLFTLAAFNFVILSDPPSIFNFDTKETSGEWFIVNDDVMGGRSASEFELLNDGTATFSGELSLENNGGFASVRASTMEIDEDYQGVRIFVRGDGREYNMRFRTNLRFDGYAYQAKFQTIADTWMEFKIPFSKFSPTFRGRTLENKPQLESSEIKQIGILVADKNPGTFTISIDWIQFY